MATVLFVFAVIGSSLAALGAGFYLIGRLFARLSGYSRLERDYRCAAPPPGWLIERCTGGVGAIRFRQAMNLQPAAAGLYVRAQVIFALPVLCIPWREFEIDGQQMIYRRPSMALRVGHPAHSRLTVPLDAYNAMLPWLRR